MQEIGVNGVMMAVWVALAIGLLCVRAWVCIIKRSVSNERKCRIARKNSGRSK